MRKLIPEIMFYIVLVLIPIIVVLIFPQIKPMASAGIGITFGMVAGIYILSKMDTKP